eukprot:Sspe_Gene.86293::Locus_56979_Transcript_1_1_Confidence_1.000_Length_684::g.86293::m.86293
MWVRMKTSRSAQKGTGGVGRERRHGGNSGNSGNRKGRNHDQVTRGYGHGDRDRRWGKGRGKGRGKGKGKGRGSIGSLCDIISPYSSFLSHSSLQDAFRRRRVAVVSGKAEH